MPEGPCLIYICRHNQIPVCSIKQFAGPRKSAKAYLQIGLGDNYTQECEGGFSASRSPSFKAFYQVKSHLLIKDEAAYLKLLLCTVQKLKPARENKAQSAVLSFASPFQLTPIAWGPDCMFELCKQDHYIEPSRELSSHHMMHAVERIGQNSSEASHNAVIYYVYNFVCYSSVMDK